MLGAGGCAEKLTVARHNIKSLKIADVANSKCSIPNVVHCINATVSAESQKCFPQKNFCKFLWVKRNSNAQARASAVALLR